MGVAAAAAVTGINDDGVSNINVSSLQKKARNGKNRHIYASVYPIVFLLEKICNLSPK